LGKKEESWWRALSLSERANNKKEHFQTRARETIKKKGGVKTSGAAVSRALVKKLGRGHCGQKEEKRPGKP